jgi:hypothetical protein
MNEIGKREPARDLAHSLMQFLHDETHRRAERKARKLSAKLAPASNPDIGKKEYVAPTKLSPRYTRHRRDNGISARRPAMKETPVIVFDDLKIGNADDSLRVLSATWRKRNCHTRWSEPARKWLCVTSPVALARR